MSSDLLVSYEGTIQKILFNRPERKNAISFDIYRHFVSILHEGATNPNVTLTVLSGVGSYYSSGTDMANNSDDIPAEEGESPIEKSYSVLKKYIAAFIDYPKPLIAIVNGPAIGISVTTLTLCDVVFASNTATFHTPFTTLGMTPEGTSSLTFPDIMGSSLASDMLLFGRKLGVAEALKCGLVSRVYKDVDKEVWPQIRVWSSLPPKSLIYGKQLVREPRRKELHEANHREVERLKERWQSEEFGVAVVAFFNRNRSKL